MLWLVAWAGRIKKQRPYDIGVVVRIVFHDKRQDIYVLNAVSNRNGNLFITSTDKAHQYVFDLLCGLLCWPIVNFWLMLLRALV
jgi:type IV secretory pathway VirB9-like protein